MCPDVNGDGVISYPEFMSYFRKHLVDTDDTSVQRLVGMSLDGALGTIRQRLINKVGAQEHALLKAFRVFDKDGGGTIDTQEFFSVLKNEFLLVVRTSIRVHVVGSYVRHPIAV